MGGKTSSASSRRVQIKENPRQFSAAKTSKRKRRNMSSRSRENLCLSVSSAENYLVFKSPSRSGRASVRRDFQSVSSATRERANAASAAGTAEFFPAASSA